MGNQKPIKWYIYKTLAEITYWGGHNGRSFMPFGWYYYWLNKTCKTGYNLYGQKIKE